MGHSVIAHQRRPDAEENLERELNLIAMIPVESIWGLVVRSQFMMCRIDLIEREFMSRFFDVLETRVKRVAPAGSSSRQEGLRLPIARSVVLAPDKCVRPVSIGTKRVDCKSPRLSCDELWSQGGALRDL